MNGYKTKIYLYQTKHPAKKLQKIVNIAEEYHKRGTTLIITGSKEALEYIENLFWTYSSDTFLPTSSNIFDKTPLKLINFQDLSGNFQTVLNLTPDPIDLEKTSSHLIIEFEDSNKKEFELCYKHRFAYYQNRGCLIQLAEC